jgi:hypothetical protein
MTNGLAIQIARLLNESDVFVCKFVPQSGVVYDIIRDPRSDEYFSTPIAPEIWLEAVRGA